MHASDYVGAGIPSIMPTNIGSRLEIQTDNIAFISEKDAERLEKYLVKESDIVYSRRGDIEKCAFITKKQSGWLCGTGCLRVRFFSDEVLPRFCAYYLTIEEVKGWVSGNAVGTTMPNLNSSILQRLPITLPPLSEQKAIAAILSSLDDKIDLLHRQNKTLEAMAETLFLQWFVGEAGEDWEEKSLLDVIDLVGGGTPKTSVPEYWDGDIPWLSGGDIASSHKSFLISSEKTITKKGLENSSAKLLPRFATVISARGTVGKYAILSRPMAYSQSNYGILPKIKGCFFFTYLVINHAVNELRSSAYGSVFDTITTATFRDIVIAVPKHEEIEAFEKEITVYFAKKLHCLTQIRTLEKLRDTLLPKLMSGEIRVTY